MRRVIVVLALVVAALVAWSLRALAEPRPWVKPPTIDGEVVTTTYTGSDCQSYDHVDVDEGSERVVITVWETVLARGCNDMGVPYDVRVELDETLGDRELVDGACLVEELEGRADCDG